MSFTNTFSSASINGYQSIGSSWGVIQTLTPNDPSARQAFGAAFDINASGSYVAVTSEPGYVGYNLPGACYIFTGNAGSYTQQYKITPATGNNIGFGTSVSLNSAGDNVAVGSYTSPTGSLPYNGNVYIFTRTSSTWSQQQVLRGSDSQNNDQFGITVSLDDTGDYCLVGAPNWNSSAGKVYIFNRVSNTWSQQAAISSPVGELGTSAQISNDGTYAVVGAPNSSVGGTGRGVISVYTRSGSTWSLQQQIQPSGLANNARFGTEVSINSSNDKIVVSTEASPDNTYYYTRSGSTWTLQQTIPTPNRLNTGTTINDSGNILLTMGYLYNYSTAWNLRQAIYPSGLDSMINGTGNTIIGSNYIYSGAYAQSGIVYIYGL